MRLTDNVEIFIANLTEPVHHLAEFSNNRRYPGDTEYRYVAADAGDHFYGITVVFGPSFNIMARTNDPKYGEKVKACRFRATIDGGIAVQECIWRLPDVVNIENDEKKPAVHRIDVFLTASLAWDGKLEQCRIQIETVPEAQPNVFDKVKMPAELVEKIGHIDIEFERGYLDFRREDQDPPFVPHIPGAFNRNYCVTGAADVVYRAKLVPCKEKRLHDGSGLFVAAEKTKRLRIDYLCRSSIDCGVRAQYISRREQTAEFLAMRAAANAFYRNKKAYVLNTKSRAESIPAKHIPKEPRAKKRGARVVDLTEDIALKQGNGSAKKRVKREAEFGNERARFPLIDLTVDLDDEQGAASGTQQLKREQPQIIDLTEEPVTVKREQFKSMQGLKTQPRNTPSRSRTAPPVNKDHAEGDSHAEWGAEFSGHKPALVESMTKSKAVPKPTRRAPDLEKAGQRATYCAKPAVPTSKLEPQVPESSKERKTKSAECPVGRDSFRLDAQATKNRTNRAMLKAARLTKMPQHEKVAMPASPLTQCQSSEHERTASPLSRNSRRAPILQAQPSSSAGTRDDKLSRSRSVSVSASNGIQAVAKGVTSSRSQSSSLARSPSPCVQPDSRNEEDAQQNGHSGSLSPTHHSADLTKTKNGNGKRAVIGPEEIQLLGTAELHVLKAKFDYLAARKSVHGRGNSSKALLFKITGLHCSLELHNREIRALQAELKASK
ncbi:hypothetical protein, variant 2 [Verruconis gallopava]|uniref:Uncharacterized protein n=1 Tax=Verruconis gallopava TaxID=253628 RepID=A0A0D1XCF7_9PEZI|nr:uncharacterized protein PV09_08490 [Verruconis gallopava]XP_016209851.1 hypothetical protein, variant 1 [Verruconis gallopava]XP_016209852.1 hypothetical protein, variant 2 [Verruconis gallopava]KIV99980.1 hypothetical protein PV09_08490 [Verruconis gallopava]KIV99981.1 hypothetical protein, variant 1 [Verruconis gallopava]KIV99982.1 hypothetical protein, variant 2 [Verruconis gallopava]